MPILYIVSTPIGNLEDITLRALRILNEVSLIAAEDTRKTKRLLAKYDIRTPMTSYYEHSKLAKSDYILNRLREADVALVSEAGTPGINDPGYELIRAAIERGISVVPIPGPTTVAAALVVSGLPTDRFLYIGFLPNKQGERRKSLGTVAGETATLILLESPHRITDSLTDILGVLGDRRIAVCRELTKIHEEVFRGRVSEALVYYAQPRGEFTLVIEGKQSEKEPQIPADIDTRMNILHNMGLSAKDAATRLSEETGIPKKEIYQKYIDLKKVL